MKRFIIVCAILLLLAAGVLSVYSDSDAYRVDPDARPERIAAHVEGDKILVDAGQGPAPFEIRGVEVFSAIPGHFSTDFAVDRETYERWFDQIEAMGANTVRVVSIQAPAFYEALRSHNMDAERPLHLLQGLWLDDYVQNSHIEAFDDEYLGKLEEQARTAIDVVHGARPAFLGRLSGSGSYTADVSAWTLGYVVGIEWESKTVAYTDLVESGRAPYEGTYVSASVESTPFESMLAELLDTAFAYETSRYGDQRLISVSNTPMTDPFEYPDDVRELFGKSSEVDMEHLVPSERVESGLFALYSVRPATPDFPQYDPQGFGMCDPHGNVNTYYAYVRQLAEHHALPVVMSGVGASASRGKSRIDASTHRDEGGMSEDGQARALVQSYRDVMEAGCSGSIVCTWQDDWSRRAWNTMENVDLLKTPRWRDLQTSEGSFGLIALDPGAERSACYVDGDDEEWGPDDALGTTGEYDVSAKYDEGCVYLMVRGAAVSPDAPLYLPVDTTPRSGSHACDDMDLFFGRDADFLVALERGGQGRVLVQERYETLRATSLLEVTGADPFVDVPEPDSPVFAPIRLLLQPYTDFSKMDDGVRFNPGPNGETAYALTYETGRLVMGDGNPSHEGYTSLADFCYGDGFVEIRLPWQLLNFANPSQMQIHDDYYEHYGVEYLVIDEMHVGAGDGAGKIELLRMPLKGWGSRVSYHERPRRAYTVLGELWNSPDAVSRASEMLDALPGYGDAL